MLGATHALANPLTARYGIVHGQAIGLMLPHVIRFNGARYGAWYHDLLEGTGGANGFPSPDEGVEGLARFVAELVHKAGLPATAFGVRRRADGARRIGRRRGQAMDQPVQSPHGRRGRIAGAVRGGLSDGPLHATV